MIDPRALITVLLILFIVFTPSTPNTPDTLPERARIHFLDILARESRNLDVLNSTRYGDFSPSEGRWLNLTGFRGEVVRDTVSRTTEENEGDGEDKKNEENEIMGFEKDGWEILGRVKERVRERMGYLLGDEGLRRVDGLAPLNTETQEPGKDVETTREDLPLYKNVSGVVHGEWARSPLQENLMAPVFNMSPFAPEGPFGPLEVKRFGRNLTEEVRKGWVRVMFEEADEARTLLSKATPRKEKDGKIGEGVEEKRTGVSRSITASINIGSEESGDDWEAQVYGVHFLETGNIVLTTTSDKFAGIFALPHLTVSEHNYGYAQELLNRSIARTIQAHEEGLIDGANPWTSVAEGGQVENAFSAPKCELVLYLQQHPVSLPVSTLPLIESELRHPTGAFPPPTSDMRFSMLAFSPDCGYVLESKGPPDYVPQEGDHLSGPKVEVEFSRARRHILFFSLVLFGQILLLIRQMQDASTPSTRSRISFYTIATLSMGDGFTTMTLCLGSLFLPAVWVPLIGSAFLAFMNVSFFGMRFLLDIHTVQAPERERAERARREAADAVRAAAAAAAVSNSTASATESDAAVATMSPAIATPAPPSTPAPPPVQAPIITPAGVDMPPLPTTHPHPPANSDDVFIPSDQDITQPVSPSAPGAFPVTTTGPGILPTTNPTTTPTQQQPQQPGFGTLCTRFYFLLLATLFLSLNASSWPPYSRRLYFTTLSLLYLSLWIPQIHRNIHRNCRRALRWDFVAGQTVLRLLPFLYFYGYSKNVLFAQVDFIGLAVLAAWVWCQVLVLVSQEVLGPRWFLVGRFAEAEWVPRAYEYHPLLRIDEEGGNLPVGAAEAFEAGTGAASGASGGRRKSSGASITAATAASAAPGASKTLDTATAETKKHDTSNSGSSSGSGSGKRTFDCAICMNDLTVPVFEGNRDTNTVDAATGSSSSALVLERRKYMVTPCRHIFHSHCLEGWMKYRLQCPVCREELPPV